MNPVDAIVITPYRPPSRQYLREEAERAVQQSAERQRPLQIVRRASEIAFTVARLAELAEHQEDVDGPEQFLVFMGELPNGCPWQVSCAVLAPPD